MRTKFSIIVPCAYLHYTVNRTCCMNSIMHCLLDHIIACSVDDNFIDRTYTFRNKAAGDLS